MRVFLLESDKIVKMNRTLIFHRMAYLIAFIFFVNLVAVKLYWYSLVWYFDMPMHFLGGVWLGLAMFWLLKSKEFSGKNIFLIFLGVLVVGVGWEIFEIVVDRALRGGEFNVLDTMSDIFFDLAGGFSVVLYYFRKYGSIAII